jgi:hypothetical protein
MVPLLLHNGTLAGSARLWGSGFQIFVHMSAESIGIALSAATLAVIAATAVAAIVQLRHLRASNQLSALLEILDQWNQPALRSAYSHFSTEMPAKIADPKYLKQLESPGSFDRSAYPEFLVFDLWEQLGTYAKYRLIDETMLLDIVASQVQSAWRLAAPALKAIRRRSGPAAFENFEYLVVRAGMFEKRFPNGTYPRGMPRMGSEK